MKSDPHTGEQGDSPFFYFCFMIYTAFARGREGKFVIYCMSHNISYATPHEGSSELLGAMSRLSDSFN